MATTIESVVSIGSTSEARLRPPWFENPNSLVALRDMRFEAVKAMKSFELLAKIEMASILGRSQIPSPTLYAVVSKDCHELAEVLRDLGLKRQAEKALDIATFMRSHNASPDVESIQRLSLLVRHDLESYVFEAVPVSRAEYYSNPLRGWENVIARFTCSWDVEEAGKCLAFERYTASVFHLMRIVESGVLELQAFLDKPDPKAHFGSVLRRLDDLNRKTEFKNLPDHLKPYRDFLKTILAQLYSVKDAWRDKVSHVGNKIVPTGTFTERMAEVVYSATLLLMTKLSDGLPPLKGKNQ